MKYSGSLASLPGNAPALSPGQRRRMSHQGRKDQQLHSCNLKALPDLEQWVTPTSNCTVWKRPSWQRTRCLFHQTGVAFVVGASLFMAVHAGTAKPHTPGQSWGYTQDTGGMQKGQVERRSLGKTWKWPRLRMCPPPPPPLTEPAVEDRGLTGSRCLGKTSVRSKQSEGRDCHTVSRREFK